MLSFKATVIKELYASGDREYVVALVRVPPEHIPPEVGGGSSGVVKAVGGLGAVVQGIDVSLTGYWSRHPKHGWAFTAAACTPALGDSPDTLQRYLESLPQIGAKRARAITELCSSYDDLVETLKTRPERLATVEGITIERAKYLASTVLGTLDTQHNILYFTELGFSLRRARTLTEKLGKHAAAQVAQNPYVLAPYIGFEKADELAQTQFSVQLDDPRRLTYLVLHAVQHEEGHGHTWMHTWKLKAYFVVPGTEDKVNAALEAASARGIIAYGEGWVAKLRTYAAEKSVAEHIRRLQRTKPEPVPFTQQDASIQYDALQLEAIQAACTEPVVVLTGGPGTGKTTIIKALVQAFSALVVGDDEEDDDVKRPAEPFLCMAPTGKAAKRISEQTGQHASTIHRALAWSDAGPMRNADDPLDTHAIIVDEVSMVDVNLMRALLDAVQDGTRLILVGDADQLPPVGPGHVLRDLLASQAVHAVRLERIYRQANESWIPYIAWALNAGQDPPVQGHPSITWLNAETEEEVIAQLQYVVTAWPEVQVLVPQRIGSIGTEALNRAIQQWMNPDGKPTVELDGGAHLRTGDRVIQTENNYELGVFNGDVGRVISGNAACVEVAYDVGTVTYATRTHIEQLELAYALTVHKFQGSQSPQVAFISHEAHRHMLTRTLAYTAVTRASENLAVLGQYPAFANAGRKSRDTRRQTFLCSWLDTSRRD